jgi:hypothetical protein
MLWSERFAEMCLLLVMAALLRTSYELSRWRGSAAEQDGDANLLAATVPVPLAKEDMLPWQKEASAKAIKKYAEAQGKKWRRWNEAMFERV